MLTSRFFLLKRSAGRFQHTARVFASELHQSRFIHTMDSAQADFHLKRKNLKR
jgi:hypothetical protein